MKCFKTYNIKNKSFSRRFNSSKNIKDRKFNFHPLFLLLLATLFFSCSQAERKQNETSDNDLSHYSISPVNIQNVAISDDFWLPIIERVQEVTINYALEKSQEEGRLDNFLIAGGKMSGKVRGEMPFDDSDVYKIIEGASNSLISAPNQELEVLLDSLIAIVEIGQEKDGYLTTWRTINPAEPPAPWVKVKEGKRWESLFMSHELYNAGHMYEAAAVHYKATGKFNFLDIAIKNADLMVETFGEGGIEAVPGHQIIETGLIKLYKITKKEEYLQLAKLFLDRRGVDTGREQFGPYAQDHKPVTEQEEVVGHAVRAIYMYAGMTDIANIYEDSAYQNAVNALWENMVHKKMYLTGGIGAKHEGEAFGENYELPNLTAYSETCAAIGSVYWNHRLFMQSGNSDFYNVIERTLYNAVIPGLSLDGKKFFYPNALESDGEYKFNRGECSRQSWFDCSCCPTNLIRFLPSLPGLIYAKKENTIFVNLFASNTAEIELENHNVQLIQETQYPWNGDLKLKVNPEKAAEFTVKIRIPGWSQNQVIPGDLYHYNDTSPEYELKVNGTHMMPELENGYITLNRQWKKGDEITLSLPMEVKKVSANKKVVENRNKIAIEYGPIVYAFEEVDNPSNFDELQFSSEDSFSTTFKKNLLGGINQITLKNNGNEFKAIPYYAWSNRGVGKMKIWINNKLDNSIPDKGM